MKFKVLSFLLQKQGRLNQAVQENTVPHQLAVCAFLQGSPMCWRVHKVRTPWRENKFVQICDYKVKQLTDQYTNVADQTIHLWTETLCWHELDEPI